MSQKGVRSEGEDMIKLACFGPVRSLILLGRCAHRICRHWYPAYRLSNRADSSLKRLKIYFSRHAFYTIFATVVVGCSVETLLVICPWS